MILIVESGVEPQTFTFVYLIISNILVLYECLLPFYILVNIVCIFYCLLVCFIK